MIFSIFHQLQTDISTGDWVTGLPVAVVCEVPNEVFCKDPANTCLQMCCQVGTYWSGSECVPYQRQQNGSWWLPKAAKNALVKGTAKVLYETLPNCEFTYTSDQLPLSTFSLLPNGELSQGV